MAKINEHGIHFSECSSVFNQNEFNHRNNSYLLYWFTPVHQTTLKIKKFCLKKKKNIIRVFRKGWSVQTCILETHLQSVIILIITLFGQTINFVNLNLKFINLFSFFLNFIFKYACCVCSSRASTTWTS